MADELTTVLEIPTTPITTPPTVITTPDINQTTLPSHCSTVKPKPKRRRRLISKGRMSKLFYDVDGNNENVQPFPIAEVISTAKAGTNIAEVLAAAKDGAPVATAIQDRLIQTVELSALYYRKEDYLNVSDLKPRELYPLNSIFKTAFRIQEGEGYGLIHDVLYPNSTYYALIVRFIGGEDNGRLKEIIVPGSLKLYGDDDANRDIVYKCICDMKITELLGDWLDTKDVNADRIPYPGQRIYQKMAAKEFTYDPNNDRFAFA